MNKLNKLGNAALAGLRGLRSILSTGQRPERVLLVDATFNAVAMTLAMMALNVYADRPVLSHFDTGSLIVVACMSVIGGCAGYFGAVRFRRSNMQLKRSVVLTAVWVIVAPFMASVLLAAAAGSQGDLFGVFVIASLIGPTMAVLAYRFLSFIKSDTVRSSIGSAGPATVK